MNTERKSYFLTLFNRGRYVTSRSIAQKEASSKDRQYKHEERERFAVAAIAFCIKHHLPFRRHFLKVIANREHTDVNEVDVEPRPWGDLVLQGNDVVVLEFKLKALLAEHQDPNKTRFASSGYGYQMRKEYGARRKILYVVIGKDVPAGRTKNGIPYRGLPWSAFLIKSRKESPVEHDLFDCLAVLGVSIFVGRHMKKKTLTHEAAGAMEVYRLLKNAAGDIATGAANSGPDYIGLDLLATRTASSYLHKKLVTVVGPRGRRLGWIGYEKLDELCLSVWFYSPPQRNKQLKDRVEGEGLGRVVEDGGSVGVNQPATKVRDHEAWITRVLKRIAR
jgi:hypothetical protein